MSDSIGGPPKLTDRRKMVGLVALVTILIVLYLHSMAMDRQRERERVMFCGALEIANDPVRDAIERSIHEYKYKKRLAMSATDEMTGAVLLGFIRGAIIGVVLGGGEGLIAGLVSFGSLNGILQWMSMQL